MSNVSKTKVKPGSKKPAAKARPAPKARKAATKAKASPIAGKLRVADFDAEDVHAFTLTPGTTWKLTVGKAAFRFASAALEGAAGLVYPSQQGLSGRHPVAGDGEPTSGGDYLPAIIFPRAQLDELLTTGTTRAFGPWTASPVAVEVEKQTTAKVKVKGKVIEVPILRVTGEDLTLELLCSTALPLILDRTEAGSCRLSLTELSALPELDDGWKPILRALQRSARAADKSFGALGGDARLTALFARLRTSEHAFEAQQELVAWSASEDLTPTAIAGLGEAVLALPRQGLTKPQQLEATQASYTLQVLGRRPHAAGHALLRQIAERMELPRFALDATTALARRQDPADRGWVNAMVARYRQAGRLEHALAIASAAGPTVLYDSFVDLFSAEALATPPGVAAAEQVMGELTIPMDPRWPELVAPHVYRSRRFVRPFSFAVSKGTPEEAGGAVVRLLEAMLGHEREPGDLRDALGGAPPAIVGAWLTRALDQALIMPWSEVRSALDEEAHDAALLARIDERLS